MLAANCAGDRSGCAACDRVAPPPPHARHARPRVPPPSAASRSASAARSSACSASALGKALARRVQRRRARVDVIRHAHPVALFLRQNVASQLHVGEQLRGDARIPFLFEALAPALVLAALAFPVSALPRRDAAWHRRRPAPPQPPPPCPRSSAASSAARSAAISCARASSSARRRSLACTSSNLGRSGCIRGSLLGWLGAARSTARANHWQHTT